MNSVLQKDIEYFIEDFEQKSQIELLEGREKTELEKIAESKGIKVKGSRDLAIFKTIYAFTDRPNKNGAILPRKDLLKVLPQIIGKPISVNHNRRFVVGHYVDYKYIQKDNSIIAYGVFYKSNFGEEWETAQKLFKKNKLSSSFEIWSPDKARKVLEDGSYELKQMEIAGGALIFQDKDNEPAFDGADVLSIAKKETKEDAELVYASRHKESEIVGSNQWQDEIKKQVEKRDSEKEAEAEPAVVPTVPKVKCSHCQEEFETTELANIKCPKCFAILNNKGEMQYPPQVMDFNVNCPGCRNRDWLLLSKGEDNSNLRCKSCSKEYTIKYAKPEKNEILDKIQFVYTGTVSCFQCGNRIMISGVSDSKEHEVNCKKCGLKFDVNTDKLDKTRNIVSIEEKTSEERRKEEVMEKETENKDKEEKKETNETPKAEDKVTKTKAEEPKAETTKEEKPAEAPKAEVTKEEPVAKSSEEKPTEKTETTSSNTDSNVDGTAQEKVTPDASEESTQTPKAEVPSQDSTAKEVTEESQAETPETKAEEIEVVDVDDKFFDALEKSKTITKEERKALPDSSFAVVVIARLHNHTEEEKKKIKKQRKIRLLPIHSRVYVRNALARLGLATKTLNKLGVSPRTVEARILRQAKKLGMTDLLKRHEANANKERKYRKAIRTAVSKIMELKKAKTLEIASVTAEADKSKTGEIAKIQQEADKKIGFYRANAQTIAERRLELGEEYSQPLSDEDIVDDEKFANVQLEKENVLLRAKNESTNDNVGIKSALGREDDFYSKQRAKIDAKAFPESK